MSDQTERRTTERHATRVDIVSFSYGDCFLAWCSCGWESEAFGYDFAEAAKFGEQHRATYQPLAGGGGA